MKEINLRLTIEETNLVLEALGNLPFVKVYRLVSKIQEQATPQTNTNEGEVSSPSEENTAPTIEV